MRGPVRIVFTDEQNLVARLGAGVHAERVFHQLSGADRFRRGRDTQIALSDDFQPDVARIPLLKPKFRFFDREGFQFRFPRMFPPVHKVAGRCCPLGSGGNVEVPRSAACSFINAAQQRVGHSGLLRVCVATARWRRLDAVGTLPTLLNTLSASASAGIPALASDEFFCASCPLHLHPFALIDFLVQLPGCAAAAGAVSQPAGAERTALSPVPPEFPAALLSSVHYWLTVSGSKLIIAGEFKYIAAKIVITWPKSGSGFSFQLLKPLEDYTRLPRYPEVAPLFSEYRRDEVTFSLVVL